MNKKKQKTRNSPITPDSHTHFMDLKQLYLYHQNYSSYTFFVMIVKLKTTTLLFTIFSFIPLFCQEEFSIVAKSFQYCETFSDQLEWLERISPQNPVLSSETVSVLLNSDNIQNFNERSALLLIHLNKVNTQNHTLSHDEWTPFFNNLTNASESHYSLEVYGLILTLLIKSDHYLTEKTLVNAGNIIQERWSEENHIPRALWASYLQGCKKVGSSILKEQIQSILPWTPSAEFAADAQQLLRVGN